MSEINHEQRDGNAVFGSPAVQQALSDEVPTELVALPSAGLIYPEGTALHGREHITIKTMTAKEEDILTSRALIKQGTVITELIRSCILDKSIDVSEMIAGDRNALMVALRITGYGAEYPAHVECGSCGHQFENSFNLGQLPLKRLKIAPVEKGQNVFPFKLPVSGVTVYFKFLTGKDQEEIDRIQEKMKKLGSLQDSVVTTRLKYAIVRVGEESNKAKIAKFVEKMRAGDSKALRRYMDEHEPGIIMRQEMNCPACGNEEEVGMPLGPQFFWPE